PIYGRASILAVRPVLRVEVTSDAPIGRWDVFVDAETGDLVAREQTLKFATGTVLFNAPERYPGAQRNDYPAKYVVTDIGGTSVTADGSGQVSFNAAPASVTVGAQSAYVSVHNVTGAEASTVLSVPSGG